MPNTDESLLSAAKKRALCLLGIRAYSKGELNKKLSEKFPPEICGKVLARLEELNYLDDYDYAEKFAKKLIVLKHYGLSKVRWEMKMKFIPDDIIEETLSAYGGEELRREITALIEKKYADKLDFKNNIDGEKRKNIEKITAALARRGYDYDDIKICLADFFSKKEDF